MSDARRVEVLERRIAFGQELDACVEEVGSQRLRLGDGLERTLPLLRDALGATRVWIETPDEERVPRVFVPAGEPAVDAALAARARELVGGEHAAASASLETGERLYARRLDLADTVIGTIASCCPDEPEREEERAALLHVAAELLDNYLGALQRAAEKQRLLLEIHDELRHPVVPEGIRRAVKRIGESVHFDLLIVIYHMEEDYQNTRNYLVFRGSQLEFGSGAQMSQALDQVLAAAPGAPSAPLLVSSAEFEHREVRGPEMADLEGEQQSAELLAALGYQDCLETVLISGIQDESVVGKLVVGSGHPLTTYERDVFDLFADVLQKRIVDFNRRGKVLQRTFSTPMVLRLLGEEDPLARLSPRAVEVSLLYADIVSFTRISEQILGDPVKVGALIEDWARGVTRILWGRAGVFDKLVGDCIIGIFGPPYYELSGPERALACAHTAAGMVRFTRDELSALPSAAPVVEAGFPLGVAIGINHCPASVGAFGPNRNFTAFSPGMNNTARLQSVAGRDEVLVMASMRPLLEEAAPGVRFSEKRAEKVKNVAEPLEFYALDIDSLP